MFSACKSGLWQLRRQGLSSCTLPAARCCACVSVPTQAGTESAQAPQLYTVLEQRKASVGAGLMGTDHVYVLPGQEGAAGKRRCGRPSTARGQPAGKGRLCRVEGLVASLLAGLTGWVSFSRPLGQRWTQNHKVGFQRCKVVVLNQRHPHALGS